MKFKTNLDLYSEMFLRNDQPFTCPRCGGRTEIIMDLSHTIEQVQIHLCPRAGCEEMFVEVRDEDGMLNNFEAYAG